MPIVARVMRANPSDSRMIDHVSLGVSDLSRSLAFYDAALAPLGVIRVWTSGDAAGYGYPGQDDAFAVKRATQSVLVPDSRSHVAFVAQDRNAVVAFHARALERGARDEGAPGLCPEYGDGYFAAFARDPDGHRLEAVRHER